MLELNEFPSSGYKSFRLDGFGVLSFVLSCFCLRGLFKMFRLIGFELFWCFEVSICFRGVCLSASERIVSSFEFEGLQFVVFESVYAPAEDSFLLAKFSKNATRRVLDVGTGCGIQALVSGGSEVVGVDVNPVAVENARLNARANGSKKCVFLEGDLFEKVEGKFDFILFNPPYLPTCENDKTSDVLLDKALDGGARGRVLIDCFLREFEDFLKPNGKLLLLHSSYAGTEKTVSKLKRKNFSVRVLASERFPFFEELSVLEASKVSE